MGKVRRRRRYEASFKAKVALAASKGGRTVSELANQFEVHAGQVADWMRKLLDNVERVFTEPGEGRERDAATGKRHWL